MNGLFDLRSLLSVILLMSGCGRADKTGPRVPDKQRATGATDQPAAVRSTRLAPRGDVTKSPRFERLDATATGIGFVHRWTPPAEFEHDIMSGAAGGGVCIGDYDGDGRPDIFLTRPFGGCRLYRNLGDFRFEDVTAAAGLAGDPMWATGPTFADIDNDGDLDLFVCGHRCASRLYINQGDGTFRQRAKEFGLDFEGAAVSLTLADYDLDGDLDAYLVTNRITPQKPITSQYVIRSGRREVPTHLLEQVDLIRREGQPPKVINAGQYDRLYRNNSDGTFTEVGRESGIGGNELGVAAVWWDYDADGYPDLYVANDLFGPDHLYHNNGDGTFTDVIQAAVPHTPWFSMGTDIADINGDGRLDLLASDMAATSHYKQKLSMGDMGSNAWFLDLAEPRQYMRNALYLNTGTERFMEVAFLTGLANTDWTWSVKFGDLDNDGRIDLFVSNGMTRDWMHSDLKKQASGPLNSRLKALHDVWLRSARRAEANLAFRNAGDLHFESVGPDWGLDHVGVSFGAAYGDLDGDGDLDLVVNNFDEPVSLYRNRVATGSSVTIRLVGTRSNRWGVGATVRATTASGTQVRYLTLARGFMSANEPVIHFGLGNNEKIDRLTIDWPSQRRQTLTNLDADRHYTITEPDDLPAISPHKKSRPMFRRSQLLSQARHKEKPFDDFARQPLLPNKLSQLGPGMAWGDIDADGDDDLLLGGGAGSPTALYRNDGGSFYYLGFAPWDQDQQSEDMGVLFFDVDRDGDLDVYVVSGGVECESGAEVLADRLYLNNGKGEFSKAPAEALPKLRESGSVVAAADFDRDGDLDLLVGGRVIPGQYPLAPPSRLLRNDNGKLTDVTELLSPSLMTAGMVTAALWSDVDGDGWIDLLLSCEWGPVRLLSNRHGKLVDRTAAAGLSKRHGWYNGITGRDLDGDGDIDYVVTNFGRNTKYHPSEKHPAMLYYGDFEKNGQLRLVEAEYEGNTLFPVRGKSCSTGAMPFLGKKFETFNQFALADLTKIYTPECLDDARRFTVTSLDSGVLINDGKGRFSFHPLPPLAQAAPAFGAVLTDIDGDGHADLCIAQNFFTPQAETGRMDGGVSLLLTGHGDGTFAPVWPDQSGVVVAADAKSLTTCDVDGDSRLDFVFGTNDGPLVVIERNEPRGSHLFHVSLAGPVGNPTGVGSRVTVYLSDGTSQTAEVYAGAGYLSQSSPLLAFGRKAASVQRVEVRWPDGRLSAIQPDGERNGVVVPYRTDRK